jgi:hypothetical protein
MTKNEEAVEILHPVTCEPETVWITRDGSMTDIRFTVGRPIRLATSRVNAMIRTARKRARMEERAK